MIKYIFFLFFLIVPSLVQAVNSQTSYYYGYNGAYSVVPLAAVTNSATAVCAGTQNTIAVNGALLGTWKCGAQGYSTYPIATTLVCPANSTGTPGTPGTCACTAPYITSTDGNSCTPSNVVCDAAGTKNSSFGTDYTVPGRSNPSTACIGGCPYFVESSLSNSELTVFSIGRSSGTTNCFVSSGTTAVSPTKPVPMTKDYCMSQGQSYITMNNVTQCVGQGTSGSPSMTNTTNQHTSVSGVPGTSTVSQTDEELNGTVTRTTTTTPASGVPGTSTVTAPTEMFCQTNPEASMCKEKKGSASGGDSCTSPPACDGDAILCAQLQQTWTARCESQATSSIRTLGEDVLNGSDPLANKPDPANPSVVPVGTLNTTEIFTGATCPAPVTANFTLMGHANTLSFDLTPFCTLGGVLGLLNVLASLFAAGRIIAGGI